MNEQQLAAERAAFENYSKGLDHNDELSYAHDARGVYEDDYLQADWELWQAALAQREPAADGEIADYVNYLHRAANVFANEGKMHRAADLLASTEAARLAAENTSEKLRSDNLKLYSHLNKVEAQLTAERARSEKLVEAAKRLSEQANRNQQYVMLYHLQSLDEALAAYQSSKENDHD